MVVFLPSLSQSVICFMFLTSMMKFVPTLDDIGNVGQLP